MNIFGKVVLSGVLGISLLLSGGGETKAANNKTNDDVILINKATKQLALYIDNKRVIINSVATGKDEKSNKTPEGTFSIVTKEKNRPYYSKNIPGGDPRNPLGARWLGLKVEGAKGIKDSWGAKTGNLYGIHGTNAPWTIGKAASGGCIRMNNPGVIFVFDNVKLGTKVKIYNDKNKSFDSVARGMGILKAAKAPAVKHTKAKVVKWKGNTVQIEYGKAKTKKSLTTSNKWYQKNLKKGKTYTFYYQGSKITKVNS